MLRHGEKKKTTPKTKPKTRPGITENSLVFFSMAPKKTKQANETAFSAPSSSPQSLALWLSHSSGLQQAQVQSPSKWSASTRSVHICSAEGCTAACSGASPGRWGLNSPHISSCEMWEGWEHSAAAGGFLPAPWLVRQGQTLGWWELPVTNRAQGPHPHEYIDVSSNH